MIAIQMVRLDYRSRSAIHVLDHQEGEVYRAACGVRFRTAEQRQILKLVAEPNCFRCLKLVDPNAAEIPSYRSQIAKLTAALDRKSDEVSQLKKRIKDLEAGLR